MDKYIWNNNFWYSTLSILRKFQNTHIFEEMIESILKEIWKHFKTTAVKLTISETVNDVLQKLSETVEKSRGKFEN